jgi:hypothetical protein
VWIKAPAVVLQHPAGAAPYPGRTNPDSIDWNAQYDFSDWYDWTGWFA